MSGTKVEAYQSAVVACALARNLVGEHDLPGLIAAIDHAEAFAPLLDPTLWMQKHKAMDEDREALEAALPLWRLARRLRESHAPAPTEG